MTDNQRSSSLDTHLAANEAQNRKSAVLDVPTLISKKWLCGHFGIPQNNPGRLYRLVLTEEVLDYLNLKTEEVRIKGFKTFSASQSKLLTKILL